MRSLHAHVVGIGSAFCLLISCSEESPTSLGAPENGAPIVAISLDHDISPPLKEIPSAPPTPRFPRPRLPLPNPAPSKLSPDNAVQRDAPILLMPAVGVSFDGLGQGFTGPTGAFTIDAIPPDTDGDVGPNHYFQVVNEGITVFDKTGTALYGAVPTNTIWTGFSGGAGLCASTNQGDGIVLYDSLADRWFVSQFAFATKANGSPIAPYYQCVAVSQTPDPTGAYSRYAFGPYSTFPDYGKFGVWPDGYYATWNMFNSKGNGFQGSQACVFDRASMLAGTAATQQCFPPLGATLGGVLPADLDGATPPPVGSPNFMVRFDSAAATLQLWRFHTDWTTPANSSLNGPTAIAVNAFSLVCNGTGGVCVPQQGTTQQLDTLGDRLMFRLAYRNFGAHESIVASHSADPGNGTSGIRWYELRNAAGGTIASGTPVVFQQGTFAPDSNWRWMGSIAMDGAGDIAVGYSISSANMFPGINYAGRLAGDALGTLGQGEATMVTGGGAQTTCTGGCNRWGDYSSLTVDPADDCTFWYTNQYQKTNGTFDWSTRVGSFKFPGCVACGTTGQACCSGSYCAAPNTCVAGLCSAAGPDAGADAGKVGADAGVDASLAAPDAGPDASTRPDAGPDAGASSGVDASVDAGTSSKPDGGSSSPDASPAAPDANQAVVDAAVTETDAAVDNGDAARGNTKSGCGCTASDGTPSLLFGFAGAYLAGRRRRIR